MNFIKPITLLFLLVLVAWKGNFDIQAQQLPYYSQFKTNMYMVNPGVTGTKRTVDARLNTRMQWVGYEGAPKTTGLSFHSRFLKGKMGAGLSLRNDVIGPSKQMELGLNYAYHIRFPDVELSLGAGGHGTKYTVNSGEITLHNNQDPSIQLATTSSDWLMDASFGLYLYNDRFHFGISGLHLLESEAKLFVNDSVDPATNGIVKYVMHANASLGYNYSSNPDYVLESTLFVNYEKASPLMLDLTMRLHYLSTVFAGYSFRPGDAVALHVGATLSGSLQISYSYDFLISNLKPHSKGSHEIMLSFSHNIFVTKNRFVHERYAYMF